MKTFNFIDAVEYPFDTNIFAHIQDDYKLYEKVISMLLTGTVPGTGNYIVFGVEESGANLTAGLLLINGELIRFETGIGRLNEDTYIRIDTDAKTETVGGVVYTTYTEKIGRSNDMTGIAIADFVRLGTLMSENGFDAINVAQNRIVSFVPFVGIAGVTTHYAKVVKQPFGILVKLQFTVDIAAMAAPATEITISNWQAAIGESYGTENVSKVVGQYAIFHLDGADLEVRQNMGFVIGRTGGNLKLQKPFSAFETIVGIDYASWEDMSFASDQTFGKYRVELECRISLNTL